MLDDRRCFRHRRTSVPIVGLNAMPLDFRHVPKDAKRKKLQRPPNYLSRRVQWKLFLLVGTLMFVVILMQEARKEKNWRWMWAFQGNGDPSAFEFAPEPDTRILRPDESSAAGGDARPPAIEVAATGSEQPEFGSDDEPFLVAARDVWSQILQSFSHTEKESFLKSLKSVREGQPLQAEESTAFPPLVNACDEHWQDYLREALLGLQQQDARLTDDEKQQWFGVIQKLRTTWEDQWKPALELSFSQEPVGPKTVDALNGLQTVLDGVFLHAVKDNTVFTGADHHAWYRLFDKLQQTSLESLRGQSPPKVGFLQLYRQSEAYRGKLVTVSGQARRCYFRPCRKNIYGIEGNYIIWLKPDGSNSPIVVYSLAVPDGFPVAASDVDGAEFEIDEPVEFTGYYFKRWAYRAKDGTRLAPVMLAKIPSWTPPPEPAESTANLPSASFFLAMIAGTAAFALAIAAAVYRASQTKNPRADRRTTEAAARATLYQHDGDPDRATLLETLKRTTDESIS